MSDLVKMMVSEVNVAIPTGIGVEAGVVMLSELDEPFRRLRIVIAQPEARAIQAAWTGAIPARPSTWDLFVSSVALLEGRIRRVVITSVQEDRHFFANLELEKAGEPRVLACRPSDAVAVALRAYGAEIFAEAAVLDDAGLNHEGTKYGPWVRPAPPATEEPPSPPEVAGTDDGPTPQQISETGWDAAIRGSSEAGASSASAAKPVAPSRRPPPGARRASKAGARSASRSPEAAPVSRRKAARRAAAEARETETRETTTRGAPTRETTTRGATTRGTTTRGTGAKKAGPATRGAGAKKTGSGGRGAKRTTTSSRAAAAKRGHGVARGRSESPRSGGGSRKRKPPPR